jgi:hypothetical protein
MGCLEASQPPPIRPGGLAQFMVHSAQPQLIVPQADSSPTRRAIGPEIPWFPVSKVEPLPGCICLWHLSTCFAANLLLGLYIIWVLEMWCRNRYVVISPTCSHRMPTPLPSTPDLCHRAHFVRDSTLATPGFGCSVPQLANDSSTESSLVQKIYKWLNPNRKEEKVWENWMRF